MNRDHLTRYRDRARTARTDLDAVLDAGMVATLATVVNGAPWVVPLLYVRDGDRILLHGSTGAGALRHVVREDVEVALSVTHLDGIVVASSTFDSSANYRSAVVYGRLRAVTEVEAKRHAMDIVSDGLLPGRVAETRSSTDKELAATAVLELPIVDGSWVVKVREGGVSEDAPDHEAWTGVIPVRVVTGDPQPSPGSEGREVPGSVTARVRLGLARG